MRDVGAAGGGAGDGDIVVRLKGYRRLRVTGFQKDPLPTWVMEKR